MAAYHKAAAPLSRRRAARDRGRWSPAGAPAPTVPGRDRARPALWDSDIHEARIAAAKLLTQARIREDDTAVWAEFLRWVPTSTPGRSPITPARSASAVLSPTRLASTRRGLDRRPQHVGPPRRPRRHTALDQARHPSPLRRAARERILGWAAGSSPTATGSSRRPSPGGSAASRPRPRSRPRLHRRPRAGPQALRAPRSRPPHRSPRRST